MSGLYIFLALIIYFYSGEIPYWKEIYQTIPEGVKLLLKIIGVSLIVPTGLALYKSLSTYEQGSKTVSAVDRFDELLYIKLSENKDKKFLVYIDDLDRVTPIIARDVLDNLRTFFDKPNISFVVAGDHTVAGEVYRTGACRVPGDDLDQAAKLLEGRRYLKENILMFTGAYPPFPIPYGIESIVFKNQLFTADEKACILVAGS